METLPKELKKVMQLTQDSLKSFEYIIMVMDERIKVEELYLSGMNKIQAQFNYIKENDPLAFESSALRVDVLQRANHNQYLVEQMKSEQEEMKLLLKKNQEKVKEVETSFRESEKTFKQKVYDLEKQKEKLTQVNKELEELTLFLQLIESDVAKSNPKWKDRKLTVVNKLKITQKQKEELDGIYRQDLKEMDTYIGEYNNQLSGQYEELVNNSNNLRNSIHDLARKQLVYEVNQIRNIQYDLDNVIKQVDSRPNFSYESEEVSKKLNPHKALNFQSFFSPYSTDVQKKIQEQPVDLDQSLIISPNTQLPGLDSNFDCITKEDRTQIQSYFQKGLIDNLNQLSLVKDKKLKDSCHYLMNSVIQTKGDSIDIDVLNLDISVILSEIQSRTTKNRQLQQEKLNQSQKQEEGRKSQSDNQSEAQDVKEDSILKQISTEQQAVENEPSKKLEDIEEGKKQTNEINSQQEEKLDNVSQQKEVQEEANLNQQKESESQEIEGQNKITSSSENNEPNNEEKENSLQNKDSIQTENVEKQKEEEKTTEKAETIPQIQNENVENSEQAKQNSEEAATEEKNEEKAKSNEGIVLEDKQDKKSIDENKNSEVNCEKQTEKVKEEQEIITDIPPVFYDYSDPQNQAIFLIFLECFRQSGKSQITPQQNNQLVIECFRYLDDLSVKKDILQLIKFMPLSFAIYRLTAAEKVFIQEKVKHHFIWTQNDAWEALIFRSIKDELNKLDPSLAEDETMYRNTVYSNLATIGLNMLKFRSTKQSTKNMIGKLALYYGIPDSQIQDLMTFIENEGQNEKSLSFVKTSNYSSIQAKPNIAKGRIITFGQAQIQQQQPATTVNSSNSNPTHGNTLHETKVNPLLQKHTVPAAVQNPLLSNTTNSNAANTNQQRFQSAYTPSTQNKPSQQLNQTFGGQPNPMLQQQQPTKHQSDFKPSNLFKQEMNVISNNSNQEPLKPAQTAQTAQIQQTVQTNPNQMTQAATQNQQTAQSPAQPIPQFANQQVPIQAQQQKPNYALPQNKVNSKLFGSNQNYALNNNKNL
ncbi:hypothetical protein TTHERM_00048950 (macronuclear) [Tetrahymena thermophila SB210]|uniref:Uncharacterized protein n=1 Tax=Tetrahymena thermophila (strain SB210) TaxID=312017 RepID=Q23D95_TETTS|nr:hypothetical protein TTHERM_00048950 [Tetrahymena thermophila SB210]EAR94539.1 hypothetical protein TTHERM_00048950 [Tetrahymena thermophila SB210]|eukprot:XP_001014791.1 hypothetical protein TTHERM_00048950 [Tetrahymena thermophila SB210]